MRGVRRARRRLLAFPPRHGRIHPTRSHWTRGHRRWLAEQRFAHAAQQIVFEEPIQAIAQATTRRDRLALEPVVTALQA